MNRQGYKSKKTQDDLSLFQINKYMRNRYQEKSQPGWI